MSIMSILDSFQIVESHRDVLAERQAHFVVDLHRPIKYLGRTEIQDIKEYINTAGNASEAVRKESDFCIMIYVFSFSVL